MYPHHKRLKQQHPVRGGVKKKKPVLLGGRDHKMATPPPSPSSGQSTSFFCRKNFFCLQSPETEKKNYQT